MTTKFPGKVEVGEEIARICAGRARARASRETIAASIQKVAEDLMLQAVRRARRRIDFVVTKQAVYARIVKSAPSPERRPTAAADARAPRHAAYESNQLQ